MNIVPEAFALAFTLQAKLVLTPMSISLFIALAFCVAVVWKWAKKKI